MMNQVTNLVQWKNLTDDQKAEYDFEGYAYETQGLYDLNWFNASKSKGTDEARNQKVYRLKIEPEKWYMVDEDTGHLGENIIGREHRFAHIRPAKTSEIPEQEPSLENKSNAELIDNWEKLERWVDDIVNYEPNQIGEYSYFRVDRFKDIMKEIKAGVE